MKIKIPDENYMKIVDQIDKGFPKLRDSIKKNFINKYGTNSIGIFGHYKSKFNDVDGKCAIDFLAVEFAKMGFNSITGELMHRQVNGKIESSAYLIDNIGHLIEHGKTKLFSKALANIPPKAIFLLSSDSSSTISEEEEFSENRDIDKKLGIGFITNSVPKNCPLIKECKIDNITYWICSTSKSSDCKEHMGKCPFYDNKGIDRGRIETYLGKGFMILAIVNHYKDIPIVLGDIQNKS